MITLRNGGINMFEELERLMLMPQFYESEIRIICDPSGEFSIEFVVDGDALEFEAHNLESIEEGFDRLKKEIDR